MPGDERDTVRQDPQAGDVLEGGEIEPLQDYPVAERHRADTARYLAYALVGSLVLTIVLHYALTVLLIYTGKTDGIANLDKTFNVLLPILSGLVGGATTYYFTRERR